MWYFVEIALFLEIFTCWVKCTQWNYLVKRARKTIMWWWFRHTKPRVPPHGQANSRVPAYGQANTRVPPHSQAKPRVAALSPRQCVGPITRRMAYHELAYLLRQQTKSADIKSRRRTGGTTGAPYKLRGGREACRGWLTRCCYVL